MFSLLKQCVLKWHPRDCAVSKNLPLCTNGNTWEQRGIATATSVLLRRHGGHSALVSKRRNWTPNKRKKDKYDLKNHDKNLPSWSPIALKKEKHEQKMLAKLENDADLIAELDQAFEFFLEGPDMPYIFELPQTLADEDGNDLLMALQMKPEADRRIEEYNHILRVYAAKNDIESAKSLLHILENQVSSNLPTPDKETYLAMISLYANVQDPSSAIRLVGVLKEKAFPLTEDIYTSVMHACVKSNRLLWAFNIFERMAKEGVVPGKGAYTVLINGCIQNNDLDKAFETFHLMRSYVAQPDTIAFTSLIHGYAQRGGVEKALNLLQDMRECNQLPSHITYNVLIHACAKSHHHVEKAWTLFHEMKAYDFYPDQTTYNTLLYACSRFGEIEKANEVVAEMEAHQVPFTDYTYNILLNTYARAQVKGIYDAAPSRKPEKAVERVHQVDDEYDEEGNVIDSFKLERMQKEFDLETLMEEHWNEELEEKDHDKQHLIGEEVDKNEMMMADDELEEAIDIIPNDSDDASMSVLPSSAPPTSTYRTFGERQEHHIHEATALFEQMLHATSHENISISIITLNAMLNVYARALRLQRAEAFYDDMEKNHGIPPNAYTQQAMIRMYLNAMRFEKAENMLRNIRRRRDEMKKSEASNQPRNTEQRTWCAQVEGETYGMMIHAYCRTKNMKRCLQLLKEAHALGLNMEEKYLVPVRRLAQQMSIVSPLIPQDPHAHEYMPRKQLLRRQKLLASFDRHESHVLYE